MSQHILLHLIGKQFRSFTFTGDLHDLKGELGFHPMVQQIGHNTVTGTDYFGNSTGAVADQVLCIAQPNSGAVGKPGDLQQIRESFRLCFQQHSAYKPSTHFRQSQCAIGNADIIQCDSKRFTGCEQRINCRIIGRGIIDFKPRIILQMLV